MEDVPYAAGELATASFAGAGGVAQSFLSAGGTGDGSGRSASGSGRGSSKEEASG